MKKSILLLTLLSFASFMKAQDNRWENYIDPDQVRTIVEKDNHLFLPTSAGLIEVDLETGAFERWSKVNGLPSNWIMAVAFHPLTGDMYVGTFDKGIAVRQAGEEQWSLLPMPDAAVNGTETEYGVICLTFDAEGGLWMGSYRGAHYFDGTEWKKYAQVYGPDTDFDDVFDIKVSETGDVYAASEGVFRLVDGKWHNLGPWDESVGLLYGFSKQKLQVDKEGGLWYVMGSIGIICYYRNGAWERVEEFIDVPSSSYGYQVDLLKNPGNDRPEILLRREGWYHWQDGAWQPKNGVLSSRPKSGVILGSGQRVAVTGDYLVFEQGDSIRFSDYMFDGRAEGFVNGPNRSLWGFDREKLYNMLTGDTILYPAGERLGYELYWKNAQFAQDGSLWCIKDHKVYWYKQGGWTVFDSTNSILPGKGSAWHLLEVSRSGTISFSAGDNGTYHFNGLDWDYFPEAVFPSLEYWDYEWTPEGVWILAQLGTNGTKIPMIWDGQVLIYDSNFDPDYEQALFRFQYDSYRDWLWAVGDTFLQYYDGESWHSYDLPDEEAFRISGIRDFIPGPDFLIVAERYDLWITHEGEWEVYNYENSPMYDGEIRSIGLDPSGGIWVTHNHFSMNSVNAIDRFQRFDLKEEQKEVIPPHQLTVIGNPVHNGQLVLRNSQPFSPAVTLKVFDAAGRLMPVQPASIVSSFLRARVQHLAAGWYVAVVEDGEQRYIAPFVVGN
ncbi:hypothetical protein [Phaeodactylibacter xiamenensis]|uniref:T9SS type A sorting domain-containing protein n=1 Tax=Phaeodactylibacter xiamenensis TaxID=1524460 RepID=UPI003CCBFAB9